MKRDSVLFVRAAGLGFGIALACVSSWLVLHWWENRPEKPVPWNPNAITATYRGLSTEGQSNTLVFFYTLENHTDRDYKVLEAERLYIGAHLTGNDLVNYAKGNEMKVDVPIYLPAHSETGLALHVAMSYPDPKPIDGTKAQMHDYGTRLAAFVVERFNELDGFVIMDDVDRYKVTLPDGWSARSKERLSDGTQPNK